MSAHMTLRWTLRRRTLRRALRIGPPGAARTKDTAHVVFSDFKKKWTSAVFPAFLCETSSPWAQNTMDASALVPPRMLHLGLLALELIVRSWEPDVR